MFSHNNCLVGLGIKYIWRALGLSQEFRERPNTRNPLRKWRRLVGGEILLVQSDTGPEINIVLIGTGGLRQSPQISPGIPLTDESTHPFLDTLEGKL